MPVPKQRVRRDDSILNSAIGFSVVAADAFIDAAASFVGPLPRRGDRLPRFDILFPSGFAHDLQGVLQGPIQPSLGRLTQEHLRATAPCHIREGELPEAVVEDGEADERHKRKAFNSLEVRRALGELEPERVFGREQGTVLRNAIEASGRSYLQPNTVTSQYPRKRGLESSANQPVAGLDQCNVSLLIGTLQFSARWSHAGHQQIFQLVNLREPIDEGTRHTGQKYDQQL